MPTVNTTRSARLVAIVLSLLVLPAAALAQPPDLGRFLEGRWGHADSNWEDQPQDYIYAPCTAGHPRADAAYTFARESDTLSVRTYGPQGTSNYLAVDSPVLLLGLADPEALRANLWDQSESARVLSEANFAVQVAFEQRGLMLDRQMVNGVLGIINEDRIFMVFWDETNAAFNAFPERLVRCNAR